MADASTETEWKRRIETFAAKRRDVSCWNRARVQGRNTLRYYGYRVHRPAGLFTHPVGASPARLGKSEKYVYVAADVYRLPFTNGLFDTATMIRTLHHMADVPKALKQVRNVLAPQAVFILEFANKLNLKAILRYWLKRQSWSPFALELGRLQN